MTAHASYALLLADVLPFVSTALPDDPSGAGRARTLVRETLTAWGLSSLTEDAELAVTELVSNAYRHGLPPVVLLLRRNALTIRIDVSDARPATRGRELPIVSLDTDESGRGWSIVEAVSDRCGTDELGRGLAGKTSYASWDCAPAAVIPQQPATGPA